jgi:hypothetical protein
VSTKVSIKARAASSSEPGFHLYWDRLDDMSAGTDGRTMPVYLRLDGVAVELRTLPNGGASVTVTLPNELARELGLLRPRP